MGQKGWIVLAWVAGVLAVLNFGALLWDAFVGHNWYRLAFVPVNLAFWGWIGIGALRRAQTAP